MTRSRSASLGERTSVAQFQPLPPPRRIFAPTADEGDGDGDGDGDGEDASADERPGPPERDGESASDGERERGRERGGCERTRGVVVVR